MTRAERQKRRRLRKLFKMRCVAFKTILSLERREKELTAELKAVRRELERTRRKLEALKKRTRILQDGFDMEKFFKYAYAEDVQTVN